MLKIISLLIILSTTYASAPFWQTKPELVKKIQAGEIIVSAKLKTDEDVKTLNLVSAGNLKTPIGFAWQELLDFANYPAMTEHFRNARHDKKKKTFYLEAGAFSYFANLWVKYDIAKPSKNQRQLNWEVYKGGFKGLKGHLTITKKNYALSEISMQADMKAKLIPIPEGLLKLGLEFVGKLMANKMRTYLEKKYLSADFYEE